MANRIPRKFDKLIAKVKIGTNLHQPGDILHIWKNDYGYRALNTRTFKYEHPSGSFLRNSNAIEILNIERGTEMSELEIERCLTISTGHISEETARKIECRDDSPEEMLPLSIYDKEEFGWWIYVPQNMIEFYKGGEDIPEDLWSCMLLAWENNCTWLCLDCDGQEVDELEMYEW